MPKDPAGDLLECVEVGPGARAAADASVVWLHGLGADGHDFEPIVPHLGLPDGLRVRFVFPHAPMIPVALNMGMVMRAWYDLRGVSLERIEHDEAGVRRSARHVEALIRRENERGVPSSRIVLAGFSQGGAMAMHVGLRHPERLAGIVALSSFLVLADKVEAEASGANRATPVLVCHGTQDPMVPERMGRASADKLRQLGHDVAYHVFPMAHQVCLEEIELLGEWIAQRLAAEKG